MAFYRDHILPYLLHLAMKNREVAAQRADLLRAAHGRVLEVGIGSGLNLPFYGNDVTGLAGVDPSARLLAMTRKTVPGLAFPVELLERGAEHLPYEADTFDSAVSTWTLCSIPGAGAALGELRRVLKPGGQLIFIEHGRAPEPAVARWQGRLNPLWNKVAGGCNMNRPIDRLITEAGFVLSRLETGYLIKGPRVLTYHYKGSAAKP